MDPTLLGRAAVTFAVLVCSLGFLTWRQSRALEVFQELDEVKRQGLLTMCTPFDEESVDLIVKMGFDILKIASCSASD